MQFTIIVIFIVFKILFLYSVCTLISRHYIIFTNYNNKISGDWWEHVVLETFTSGEWLENFRLSKDTFDYLCTQLTPHFQYQDTHLRKPISVKKRVAITLWTLASSAKYRTVNHLFGVGRSTVCEIVHETCQGIVARSSSTQVYTYASHLVINNNNMLTILKASEVCLSVLGQ